MRPTARSAATRAACAGASTSRSRWCTSRAILFLDEPTTGLDVQSRTALWDEVQRLASANGVTVFLTTQYLEEADALADRVGIIDTGKIVAEGTPDELKAEIGRPTVEAAPVDDARPRAHARRCSARFGPEAPAGPGGVAVRLDEGTRRARRRRPRARRGEPEDRQPRDPRAVASTTSSSPRPARRLEGAGDDAGEHEAAASVSADARGGPRPRRRARPALERALAGRLPRAALGHADDAPADRCSCPSLVFPLFLLAVNSSGLERRDQPPRLPDRLLPDLRARPHLHAGRAVRDDGRRPVDRRGHPARLLQPPAADPAAQHRADRRPARRGRRSRASFRRSTYLIVGARLRRPPRGGTGRRARAVRALGDGRGRVRLDRARDRAAHRQRRGRAGRLPAAVRAPLPELGGAAARPDRQRLVPDGRHDQPGQLPDRGLPQPPHHRLGRRGARARPSASRSGSWRSACGRRPRPCGRGWSAREPGPDAMGAGGAARSPGGRCT